MLASESGFGSSWRMNSSSMTNSLPLTPETPYYVIDTHTKSVVKAGTYKDRNRLRAYADRKDSAYGAVRYVTSFTK